MAAESIQLNVTAKTADLQAQLALAQVSLRSMGTEVRSLAEQMVATSQTGNAALSAGLASAAAQAAQAKARVAELSAELAKSTPVAESAGSAAARSIEDQIKLLNKQLQAGLARDQALFQQGQISASERMQQEITFTDNIYKSELSLVDRLRALYVEDTAAYRAAVEQKQQITERFDGQIQKLNDKAAQDNVKAWQQSFKPIETGFNSMIQGMLTRHQTFKAAAESALQQMVVKAIETDAARLANWVATELAMELASAAKNVATEAGDLAAAQAGFAEQKAATVQSIGVDAKGAAAGAYNSAAQIPYVGWIIAPIAAAAAFAAVAAFGSFEVGTAAIPQDMQAMLHAGEMVVPASFSDSIRSGALTLGGPPGAAGANGGGNVAVSMNVSAVDGGSFATMLNKYAKQMAKVVVQQMNANPSLRPRY